MSFEHNATTLRKDHSRSAPGIPFAILAAAATLTLQAGMSASQAILEEILTLKDAYVEFAEREARVTNYAVQGEFLGYLREVVPTVVGADHVIDIGAQRLPQALALHWMNLHLALLMDDRLRLAARAIPELVPALLDGSLYAFDPNYGEEDFVTRLVADQLRGDIAREDGLLGKFVADVMRLDV